jgi:MFS-type transporter involved in bile tolerance (Atg22 family)
MYVVSSFHALSPRRERDLTGLYPQFQTAAWGSYQVTMISEVVPAPKAYLFFALFNTVGKTSGFVGPFISSAIIKRAGGNTNASYWFLWAMGTLGVVVLWFVDPDRAKLDNAKCECCSNFFCLGQERHGR